MYDEPANQFNVVLRIGMFQKRLRAPATSTTGDTKLIYEFVAGGAWSISLALFLH